MVMRTTGRKAKAFAWSFSKLKNYETCPKRHYEVDLARNYTDEDSEALKWGNSVHAAMAARLGPARKPLPDDMALYEPWAKRVDGGPGVLYLEQKYAITKEFGKCAYFADNAWYRGIGDAVRISSRVGLVIDWKTGAIKEDSVQLALMAQCIFAHFPEVQKVRSVYAWLKEGDDCKTDDVFDRSDMADLWVGLLDRVAMLEQAYTTQSYPPKPGRLCKSWCPVTSCIHHGK